MATTQSIIDAIWKDEIQPELINFVHGLNWFYIIMFINILYGLKYTGQFNWYNTILKNNKLKVYKIWISAIILAITYLVFRWADPGLNIDIDYIASLLRSVFVAVIFSGIFVDIPALIVNKVRDFLEPKEKLEKTTEEK